MLIFALIVRWLWKPFRLPTRLHWFDSAQRCWMISLPNTQWHYIGFLDVLWCEETKLPTGLQKTVLFRNRLDLSHLWRSLYRTLKSKNAGWITSIWQCDVVLVLLRDRLKTRFQAIIQLQRPDYWPWTEHNPELLTLLPDIIPWELIGLNNHLSCRRCGTEEETSVHILCEWEAYTSHRHAHLGSFFLDPKILRV